MSDPALAFESIAALAAKIRAGALSPVALTEALLERIAALDGRLHAFIAVTRERALAEARAAEPRPPRRAGPGAAPRHPLRREGPLRRPGCADDGGHAPPGRQRGEGGRRRRPPSRAAPAWSLLGKTYTVQFAFGGVGVNHDQGTPHNPWKATHHVPGGSSSGSAVAVAAGLAPMALGSDTGGSVRVPASLCGTVGLKTTVGRVSRAGVYPLSFTLDSVGPVDPDGGGRRPRLPGAPGDRSRGTRRPMAWRRTTCSPAWKPASRGLRLAIAETLFFDEVDPEVGPRGARRAPGRFRSLGAQVREHQGPRGGRGDVGAEAGVRDRGRGLRLQRPVPRRALRRARPGQWRTG